MPCFSCSSSGTALLLSHSSDICLFTTVRLSCALYFGLDPNLILLFMVFGSTKAVAPTADMVAHSLRNVYQSRERAILGRLQTTRLLLLICTKQHTMTTVLWLNSCFRPSPDHNFHRKTSNQPKCDLFLPNMLMQD